MIYRVTQTMISNNMVLNINNSYRKMGDLQNQISSGKRINKPSDDPSGAALTMNYKSQLADNEQYQKNGDDTKAWLQATQDSLSDGSSTIDRIKELIVSASSDTMNSSDRQSIAGELTQIKEHLGDLANTQYDGKYIFSGLQTNTPAYSNGDLDPSITNATDPSQNDLNVEVAKGVFMQKNTSANDVFGTGGQGGIFKLLDQITTDLNDPTKTGADFTSYIQNIDDQKTTFTNVLTNVGAQMDRLDLASNQLSSQNANLTQWLSNTQDVDVAKAITDLSSQQTVYQAALGSSSKIMQQTLMDYLK